MYRYFFICDPKSWISELFQSNDLIKVSILEMKELNLMMK